MVNIRSSFIAAALSLTLTACSASESPSYEDKAPLRFNAEQTDNSTPPPPNIPSSRAQKLIDQADVNAGSHMSSRPPPYQDFLEDVNVKRGNFTDNAAARQALFQWIDQDMYVYWDRTTWDFNGVSRTPGYGEIACGYFVTTLLKDLGFGIDRVRLAQDVSATMIKELTGDIKITRTVEGMIEYVESQPSGSVFIVGLDFHTGFVTSGPDGIYFIHSNYIAREGVVRELAATSEALHDSGYFMIGNLSTRADTIEAWRAN